MKRLLLFSLTLILIFSLAACGGDDKPSSDESNNAPDTSQTTNQTGSGSIGGSFGSSEIDGEISGGESIFEQIDTESKTWDDLNEYTKDLPSPDFVKDSPLVLESMDEVFLRFQGISGTTIEEVKEYISELETSGYVVRAGSNTADTYMGHIEKEDGSIVINFSYNFGQVSIDVPVYYDDGSEENSEPDDDVFSEEADDAEPDNSSEEVESIDWPDNNYTNLVPEPEGATIISGGEVGGYMFQLNMTMPLEDAQIYAQQLADSGFEGTEEMWENINTYKYNGANADGWTVTFSWRDGEVTYNIKKP